MMLKLSTIPVVTLPTLKPLGEGAYLATTEKRRYYITTRTLEYSTLIDKRVLEQSDVTVTQIDDDTISPLLREHVQYGGEDSFIFDMQGINTFLYGKAKIFQDQSVYKIARALRYLQPDGRYVRMGAAGARASDYHPGGEVVEHSFIKGNGSGVSYSQSGYLPNGSKFSKRVPLHAADGKTLRDERTVYSHTMWLPFLHNEPSNNICLSITANYDGANLLDIIDNIVAAAGIKAYGIQIAVWPGTDGVLPTLVGRVLRHLPSTRIKTMDQARDIASEQTFPLYRDQTAVFFGTNYHRVEKDWEAFRNGKRYEPHGHMHGFIAADAQREDQHNLFHLRNLFLTPDTTCQVIITPIKRIVRVEPVVKRKQQIISKTNSDVIAVIRHD